jgi:hypothetical protein
MMRWPGSPYYEIRKGWKESFLMKDGSEKEIAYTDDDYVIIGTGYTPVDKKAVKDFADQYNLGIIW